MFKKIFYGILLSTAACFGANEIGYVETFALAEDRATGLDQLIPGTEDYYFYHALHYQLTKQRAAYDETLKQWEVRHPRSTGIQHFKKRQALLDYDQDPEGSLKYIRESMQLHYNAERKVEGAKLDLPTALDPVQIHFDTLLEQALKNHKNSLAGVEDAGLSGLDPHSLKQEQLRHYLSRLQHPQVPGLPKLIAKDYPHSKGFGSDSIHRKLLEDQLIELLALLPDLKNRTSYVNERLERLKPNNDVDLSRDREALAAYLDRLDQYTSTLDNAQDPLKATVLYRKLVLGQLTGDYDAATFKRYLELPRISAWTRQEHLKQSQYKVDLNTRFGQILLVDPIGGDDRKLIRDYLEHLLVKAPKLDAYAPYIQDQVLKRIFAETKILNGVGDPERWASMLSPSEYEAIKTRVEIRLSKTNPEVIKPGDQVSLTADVKNVKSLLIKVFTVNAFNYYREHLDEIHTALNLDGLRATHERRIDLSQQRPEQRVRQTFDFPELKKPGIYIIDFIGNGTSSRALVIKGRLNLVEEITPDGQAFVVMNPANEVVKQSSIWMAGRAYPSNKQGLIVLPFTTHAKTERVILQGAGMTSLSNFQHRAEKYQFNASFYVDREALLRNREATVIIRPSLKVSGARMSIKDIEDAALTITSRTHEGIESSDEIRPFALHNDGETEYTFRVPERLASIQFRLNAKIRNLSTREDVPLAASQTFTLNGMDTRDAVQSVFVTREAEGYVAELRGRNGETIAGQAIHLSLKHRMFKQVVQTTLQTDAKGRAQLGALEDIQWFKTRGPSGVVQEHALQGDAVLLPQALQGVAGDALSLAVNPGTHAALFTEHHGRYGKDLSAQVSIKNGLARIEGLEPGDYRLFLEPSRQQVPIRITRGIKRLGRAISATRSLTLPELAPVHVAEIQVNKQELSIQLGQTNRLTRVHILATRFLPEYDLYSHLRDAVVSPTLQRMLQPESLYLSGRQIGDEHQYILDRGFAKKYPGNMLQRPGLLLNPWAKRQTEEGTEPLKTDEAYSRMRPAATPPPTAPMASRKPGQSKGRSQAPVRYYNNLDFLHQASILAANLVPDANGKIVLPLKNLGGNPQVQILVLGPGQAILRQVQLPHQAAERRDLRLQKAFKPERALSEQRKVSVLPKGKAFTVDDLSTSKLEMFQSIADVYQLYATIQPLESFQKFGFIRNWPALKPEEQKERYSEFASHELNLFLYHKDRKFFDAVIRTYLANKKNHTFIDEWLLGADLSAYGEPWAFGRLNAVERILLAQRLPGRAAGIRRHEQDLGTIKIISLEQMNRLHETGLGAFGLNSVRERLHFAWMDHKEQPGAEAKVAQYEKAYARKGLDLAIPGEIAASGVRVGKALNYRIEAEFMDMDTDGLANVEGAEEGQPAISDHFLGDVPVLGRMFRSRGAIAGKKAAPAFFLKLKPTSEWAENHYYHLPIEQQIAGLILTNPFWRDYAEQQQDSFLSEHLALPTRNLAEMMLALAVLDLPFKPGEHEVKREERSYTITPAHPIVLFHKEIRDAEVVADSAIMVSQLFLRSDDRTRQVDNESVDKPVTEEFLRRVRYTGKVIVTNPSANKRTLNLLLQIPGGAMPVLSSRETEGRLVELAPYSTQSLEIDFYFPETGTFTHFPVNVAQDGKIVARAKPQGFKVVEKLSQVDETSWPWISQNGTLKQVLKYLDTHNLQRTPLHQLKWRMKDKAAFEKVTQLLAKRQTFNTALDSYALLHNDLPAAREYMKHSAYAHQVGYIECTLLTTDFVGMHKYQHLEYAPLVNPRTHPVGKEASILNHRFRGQYQSLMQVLRYRARLADSDHLAIASYLALQDRIEEALAWFAKVNREQVPSQLQYDYMQAYLGMYEARLDQARTIAERYKNHPVPRWRNKFLNILTQLDESSKVIDPQNREQVQDALAAVEPAIDFEVDGTNLVFDYQALENCTVNFYPMDIELLFSRNPFLGEGSGQFTYIRPALSRQVVLPKDQNRFSYALPQTFRKQNAMVEVLAGGIRQSQPALVNDLQVQLIETYGQVVVKQAGNGQALSTVYVKVYARMKNGTVLFFKDGYTDFRGRFDYVSLNSNALDQVERFALLILSDEHGATIKEAAPPKR